MLIISQSFGQLWLQRLVYRKSALKSKNLFVKSNKTEHRKTYENLLLKVSEVFWKGFYRKKNLKYTGLLFCVKSKILAISSPFMSIWSHRFIIDASRVEDWIRFVEKNKINSVSSIKAT